ASVALTTGPSASAPITGRFGGVVSGAVLSTITSSVAAGLVLPAASAAVALTCPAPSEISSPVKVTVQLPLPSAVVFFVVEPQATTIDAPGSAVPVTCTPAVASPESTTLSPATAAIIG